MFFLKELPSRRMVEGYAELNPSLDVDAARNALRSMRQASLMVRQIEACLAEHGLSQLRFLVLIVIDREPDRDHLGVTEIANRLDVSKPVVTRTLSRLVADDMIRIETDPADARAKLVRLTAEGRAKLEAVLGPYFALLTRLGREG